jgi:hypothetical protein
MTNEHVQSACIHACIHTGTHMTNEHVQSACIHACIHTGTHMTNEHVQHACIFMHTYIQTGTHVSMCLARSASTISLNVASRGCCHSLIPRSATPHVSACHRVAVKGACACAYNMYIYIYIYICIYIYIYIYIYI